MLDLLLIYPYFSDDKSIFKFPPLGLGYIASYVRQHGYRVEIIDCTFKDEEDVLHRAKALKPRVVGIYSMVGMKRVALRFARDLREHCDCLIAGGPLPSVNPTYFFNDFDLVCIGEGEATMLEVLKTLDNSKDLSKIRGLVFRTEEASNTEPKSIVTLGRRERIQDLDSIPFPARDLFDNEAYKNFFKKHYGYTTTAVITSRGCPFSCDFCSRPVFGEQLRCRSPDNVLDELEVVTSYGYDRIWFSDDIFPVTKRFIEEFCEKMVQRRLDIGWECLCRADLLSEDIARSMRKAGCLRVFFGLESGNDQILRAMSKHITTTQSRRAIENARSAGLWVGGFFILGYPGETNETMLDTIRFASSLPLDYLSFTLPYPIEGTNLYDKVRSKMLVDDWVRPRFTFVRHNLIWASDFSETKLKFGIIKAGIQARLNRHLGRGYPVLGRPFEAATDLLFRTLR